MSAVPQDTSMEGVPGISRIQEVRPESSSEDFKFCTETCLLPARDSNHGIRRVSCRAEIDTSPPFESVKEAVIRFGGSGPWVPFYKFGEACHGFEEFDIKKVEEEAAELEKDLIVKELETLDVLEELGTTKRNVEELKRQLKDEALKYMTKTPCLNPDAVPAIKEMNDEHIRIGSSRRPYCPVSSHDSNLMESKQAKLNLGKTINDLGVIQACVESLNKKMKKERLTCKSQNHQQIKKMADTSATEVPRSMPLLEKTAEMRLFAAKKMEEAAMASEALALIELNALGGAKGLSSNETSSEFSFPVLEPEQCPLTPKVQSAEFDEETNISELTILRKLEEASEEIKHCKKALKEVLKSVEIASKKQLDIEDALKKWIPKHEHNKHVVYNGSKMNNFHHNHPRSPLKDLMSNQKEEVDVDPKPVSRTTVSMRDTLSKKQVTPQECVDQTETKKVALSQMLDELKTDLRFHPKTDHQKHHGDVPKQFFTRRGKFGFIHLHWKSKAKKKTQALNTM